MKKSLLTLCVAVMVTGGIFSQEQDRAKNALSVHVGVIGAELSYERMYNRYFSVLADVSYTTMLFMDEFTASGKGRWYPFGESFYLEMGLGFSRGKGVVGAMGDMMLTLFTFGWYLTQINTENDIFRTGGFLVQPGLGWKIDIGRDDGFVLPLNMGLDVKLGEVPDFMPYLRLGLGYSF